jgi:hypothetical protein
MLLLHFGLFELKQKRQLCYSQKALRIYLYLSLLKNAVYVSSGTDAPQGVKKVKMTVNSEDDSLKGRIKKDNPVALQVVHDMPNFKVASECQLSMLGH